MQQGIPACAAMISGGAGVGFLDGAIRRVQEFWFANRDCAYALMMCFDRAQHPVKAKSPLVVL